MDVSEDGSEASGNEGAEDSSSADADGSDMSESGSDASGSEEDSEADSEGGGGGKAKAAGSKKVGLKPLAASALAPWTVMEHDATWRVQGAHKSRGKMDWLLELRS